MSKYNISEMYLRRLGEDAKRLGLDPSIYPEKFAAWDKFRISKDTLVCHALKEEDIPYIFSYLKSLPVITRLQIADTVFTGPVVAKIILALETHTFNLSRCTIPDGMISHFLMLSHSLRYDTFTNLQIIDSPGRCKLGPRDTISLLNNSFLKTLYLERCTLIGKNLSALSSYSTITSLTLYDCGIDSKDVAYLLRNHVLKTLVLDYNPKIGDEGVLALSLHPTITSLSLENCEIGPRGADYLSKNRVLETLNLACNDANPPIGDDGAFSLSQSTVTSLNLACCKIGPKGLDSFSKNSVLKNLDISSNHQIGEGIGALGGLSATLTCLNLGDSKIGPAEAAYFLNCPALTTLELFQNPLRDEGVKLISQIPTLTDVSLINCKISSKGAAFLKTSHLESLNLEYNPIGDEGADSLSNHPTLTRLNLNKCHLGDRGVIALARNSRLTELHVGSNNIVYWGAIALAFNQSIRKLELSADFIDPSALCFFLGNQALTFINVREPNLETNRFFDFLTRRNSSSLFQTHYPEEVREQLSQLLPTVLNEMIYDYTRGEYPYNFRLFRHYKANLESDYQNHLLSGLCNN